MKIEINPDVRDANQLRQYSARLKAQQQVSSGLKDGQGGCDRISDEGTVFAQSEQCNWFNKKAAKFFPPGDDSL